MDFTQSFSKSYAAPETHLPVADTPAADTHRGVDSVINWLLYLTVFLVPLFWLPWTVEGFELNKQFLLLSLTALAFVLWVAKVVFSKSAVVRGNWLKWVVLAWLLVVAVATYFSLDPITSVLGFYGRFNGGLVSVIAYVLLFFLVVNNIQRDKEIKTLLGWWLSSLGIGTLLLILAMYGVKIFDTTALTLFGNSLNSTVLVLAAALPLTLWLSRQAESSWGRLGSIILVAIYAIGLLLVDFKLGWIALIVGLIFWLVMVFIKNESVGFKWTTLPSLLLLLGVLAWPIVTNQFTRVTSPVEVNLSTSASWRIAQQNAKTSPIFGTGPETFILGFSEFKPEDFNKSSFWAFRFDKAASEFAQSLSTTGYLGLAVYSLIFLGALYWCWRMLKDSTNNNWYLRAAVVASFLTLGAAQILYFLNTNLALAFWLVLGLVVSLSSTKEKSISLSTSPRASFIFSFGLALVILLALGVFYGIGRLWAADVAYTQALRSPATVAGLQLATGKINKAVALNPWRDIYRITYAQVLLAQANQVAREAKADTEAGQQEQIQRLQSFLKSSIEQARAATELGPENVANWEALGSIYRGTALFAADAENWVIASFSEAITKEPSNPALYTELGKAYLLAASRRIQSAQNQDAATQDKLKTEANSFIDSAEEQFNKAVALKDDYTPAHFNQALAYELKGEIDSAIDKLIRMREFNPQDIDVLYELGTLYAGKNDTDKAIEAFSTIISIVPKHANSHYSLGVLYERIGDIEKARVEFNKVLETNPNNQLVKDKLNSLNTANTSENAETEAEE